MNFSEHRWGPSEMSGGLFSEIIYTILHGFAVGSFPLSPSKPKDFVSACRTLENFSQVPRSFQILIPRMLPALYEIRNNRGVGHVGGDVDPNAMDASAVLSISSWIMAELIRVFHNTSTTQAQNAVDALTERPSPLVWAGDGTKRILDPTITLKTQVILLLASSVDPISFEIILEWTQYKNKTYLRKLLTEMEKARQIYRTKEGTMQLLPPGTDLLSAYLKSSSKTL